MTRQSPRIHPLLAVVATGVLIAACQAPAGEASESASASTSASASASEAAACVAADLPTKTPGTLTVGTDNPAFPPYFDPPADDEQATDPWEFGDPTNGRGFESAMAYALAEQLGFTADQVDWIPVPFNNSIAPGPKDFDVYLAQVSYSAERAEQVDLSEGYFFSNQALVTTAGSPLADATTIAEVQQLPAGRRREHHQPHLHHRQDPATTGAARLRRQHRRKAALEAGQVDGVVFDLATAFYIVNVEMEDGVVVGQFPSDPEDKEHFSFVLDLDSPLTDCVNEAILTMGENGELDSIAQDWMADYLDAPFIQE